MRLLLDTHAFLWAVFDRPQLSVKARRYFQVSIGKLEIKESFERFIPAELRANRVKH